MFRTSSLLRTISSPRPLSTFSSSCPTSTSSSSSSSAQYYVTLRFFSAAASGKKPIGFVGLGQMGGHMAHNLLKNGHPLVVFDLSKPALEKIHAQAKELKGVSVSVAASPSALLDQVDTCITMLPSSPHVRSVYTDGTTGLFSSQKGVKGKVLIDSSTIDPQTSRDVAKKAISLGAKMYDAPVSGGVGGAEAGTLTFMVGGAEKELEFEQVKAILKMMGKNIVQCGGAGNGQVAKVCNNVILGMSMVAVSEGLSLGVKLGMDPKILSGIFNTSSARCWSSDTYNPCPGVIPTVPSSKDYQGGFATQLMLKDMGLATDAAKSVNHYMPLAKLTEDIYTQVVKDGGATKDFSSVYQFIKNHK